jgi:hypothetical protein
MPRDRKAAQDSQGSKRPGEQLPRPVHACPSVRLAYPHLFGYLGVRALLDLTKDKGHPVGVRQRVNGLFYRPPPLGVADPLVGWGCFVAGGAQAVDEADFGRPSVAGVCADVGEYSAQPSVETVLTPESVERQIGSQQSLLYRVFGVVR